MKNKYTDKEAKEFLKILGIIKPHKKHLIKKAFGFFSLWLWYAGFIIVGTALLLTGDTMGYILSVCCFLFSMYIFWELLK